MLTKEKESTNEGEIRIIDRGFTKRRLSKSEFEKRFSRSGVVTIQCFESHIQYETVNL